MGQEEKAPERGRRDWLIILIILLFGFLCVILAGQWAIRFAPNWRLDTDMGSNIDPNSDFLTNRPGGFIEPVDPAILTNAAWINLYQTPGAVLPTGIIPATNSPTVTPVSPTPFIIGSSTNITSPSLTPTNTLIYYPPPTNTPNPPPPSTNTPILSVDADLAITKNDGVPVVNNGDTLTYTVRVTNNGPDNVTSAILSDPSASGLSKTAVVCSPTPGQCVTPPTIAQLEGGAFALPAINNGQFYEISITANVTAFSGNVTNTTTINVPAGVNDPITGNNSATDTDTVVMVADLWIEITDNATDYTANALKLFPNISPYAYTITVHNAGPSDVTGALVSNVFSNGNANSIAWVCNPSPGAVCSSLAGVGDLNNESIDLNSGASATFYLAAQVIASPSDDLVNDVIVTVPAGFTDPLPGNNSRTDTDMLIVPDTTPAGIGTSPDGTVYIIPADTYLILQFGSPLTVGGHSSWDLVYYELPQGANPGVWMDAVTLQIGDGSNWYTIFNWGDGSADTNTNVSIPLSSPPNPTDCTGETDNCEVDASFLYNSTGIAIDLDGIVPSGSYPYIRIYSPSSPPDTDGQVEVDAIYIIP